MNTDDLPVWEIQPHTKAKHEILKKYLYAWFPIVGKFSERVTYIDGFCGPEGYAGGEPGSPLIALESGSLQVRWIKGKVNFWFCDKNEKALDHLKFQLKNTVFPENFNVQAISGKMDEVINRDDIQADLKNSPSFTLIDPFGFADLPFSLIQKILKNSGSEVMITFMVDSINRWLEHPDPKIRQHIVNYFGTEECLEIANKFKRIQELRELYQTQLEGVADYVRYFEMRDYKDRLIYCLFFATNSSLGFVKMKEAMWTIDPSGEFGFSDATNPDQLVLFKADPIPDLIQLLQSKFKDKGFISCMVIRDFVERETIYIKKHLTQAMKIIESENRIEADKFKSDGTKRRANTYPDTASIRFLT
jgi:three-Cys-motif partner protein